MDEVQFCIWVYERCPRWFNDSCISEPCQL